MTATANGVGPAPGAALDLPLPTLEEGAEPEQVRPDLEAVGGKSHELLDAIAGALRAQIAMEQVGREEHEEMIAASREREQKMTRTLRTIEAQADAAEKREQKGRRRPQGHPERKTDWAPTPERMESTWRRVKEWAEDHSQFSAGEIAKQTPGTSPDVMLKCMRLFREHELVRPVGNRRGGTLWSLMPGVAEQGDTPWLVST